MPGASAPTWDAHCKAVRDAIRSVSGIASETVHDRPRLIYTPEGWTLLGYDPAEGVREYWEVDVVEADEEELDAGEHFVDRVTIEARGLMAFGDGDDSTSSTARWRTRIGAVRDAIRARDAIFGTPMDAARAPRATRVTEQSLVTLGGDAIVHFCRLRLIVESEAAIPTP